MWQKYLYQRTKHAEQVLEKRPERDLYTCWKRSIYVTKRSIYVTKRSIYVTKRSIYVTKRRTQKTYTCGAGPLNETCKSIVLHCVALCCLCCIVLHCVALCCIVLHCVALCCIVLHCVAGPSNVTCKRSRHVTTRHVQTTLDTCWTNMEYYLCGILCDGYD